MLPFLRNGWYVAAWGEALGSAPIARTILNDMIVLYRTESGEPVALEDRCPHRLAPLSQGSVQGEGIKCGYHGLVFGTDGMCIHNPHSKGRIPPAAKVRAYPLHEKHRAVWIWMGEPDLADPALIPDFSILDEAAGAAALRRDHMMMDAPWDLIIDNLLDLSHVNFLHDGILGNETMVGADTTVEEAGDRVTVSRFNVAVTPPGFFDQLFHTDGRPADVWMNMRWNAPSALLLDVGVTDPGQPREVGTGMYGIHLLTPETDSTTHYHFAGVRWNIRPHTESEDLRESLSDMRRFAFAEQDLPMIAGQKKIWEVAGPEMRKPVWLDVDVGIARWRKVVEAKLQLERDRPTTGE